MSSVGESEQTRKAKALVVLLVKNGYITPKTMNFEVVVKVHGAPCDSIHLYFSEVAQNTKTEKTSDEEASAIMAARVELATCVVPKRNLFSDNPTPSDEGSQSPTKCEMSQFERLFRELSKTFS